MLMSSSSIVIKKDLIPFSSTYVTGLTSECATPYINLVKGYGIISMFLQVFYHTLEDVGIVSHKTQCGVAVMA